jgi:hypothetical protein
MVGGPSSFSGSFVDPEKDAREEVLRREREREFYRSQDHDMGEDISSSPDNDGECMAATYGGKCCAHPGMCIDEGWESP